MKYVCIALLKIYKATLSKIIGRECKFSPTCSVYSMEAYKEHGFFKGTFLTAKRLLKCSPLGKGGFDPVVPSMKSIKWII
ncbi:MAG: membrane protein insertion efficiency factor YidD [Clostridia bacterium]|nr:membrane protein insertion efficiency factor YidD [Clostridia bacterium]